MKRGTLIARLPQFLEMKAILSSRGWLIIGALSG
jgi:hypothetical protein